MARLGTKSGKLLINNVQKVAMLYLAKPTDKIFVYLTSILVNESGIEVS